MEDEEEKSRSLFFPALSCQRYAMAASYLSCYHSKKLVDFGCSECKFLAHLTAVPSLEAIAFVDIDRDLLERRKFAIQPDIQHYVARRLKPLHVSLLAGSVEELDSRLLGYDAVTLIEVIEHLRPDVLARMTSTVFGRFQPELCVTTTPNAEFNVVFGNSNPHQFRHWDHKFEWTRQEFSHWCENICRDYGYSVEYTGVGFLNSRPDTVHLGPCTQAAVFTRVNSKRRNCHDKENQGCHETETQGHVVESQGHVMESQGRVMESQGRVMESQGCHESVTECYHLVAEAEFPYREVSMTPEEHMDLEVSYTLRQLVHMEREEGGEREVVYIEVARLAEFQRLRRLGGQECVRESLLRNSFSLTPDENYIIVKPDDFNDCDDESEDGDDHYIPGKERNVDDCDNESNNGDDQYVPCDERNLEHGENLEKRRPAGQGAHQHAADSEEEWS